LGIDAIAAMGPVLVGIDELARRLAARKSHALLGSGSIHASLIEGGQEYSSYPARCLLNGERRTVPGETLENVERELRGLFRGLDAELRLPFSRTPFEVAEDDPLVQTLLRHAGVDTVTGVGFWADSALLAEAGIATVVFGPRGEGAHAATEWVDLGSLEHCARIYAAVAGDYCA